jgi:hypothetical protein
MQVNENLLSNLLAFVGVMSSVLLLTTWLFPEVPYPTMLTAFATVYVLLGVILYTFILLFRLIYGAVLRNVK